jgi:hypothetical protein
VILRLFVGHLGHFLLLEDIWLHYMGNVRGNSN